jgi:uncharacterized membrane protein
MLHCMCVYTCNIFFEVLVQNKLFILYLSAAMTTRIQISKYSYKIKCFLICSFNFLILLAVCLNISTVINIKILTNSNQQTQSYKFASHIAAFLSVILITRCLKSALHTSYDQNVQLILKSYLPVEFLKQPSSDSKIRKPDHFKYVRHSCEQEN